jgi:hypothetical protein
MPSKEEFEKAAQDVNRALGTNIYTGVGIARAVAGIEGLGTAFKEAVDKLSDYLAEISYNLGWTSSRRTRKRREGRRRHMKDLKRDRRDKRRKRGYR